MILVGAVLLAVFVLPPAWGVAAVAAAAAIEVVEIAVFIRLSRRWRIQAGAETLIGARAVTASACRPHGQVRLQGELWQARCRDGVDAAEAVRVVAREGLVLVVEPERD